MVNYGHGTGGSRVSGLVALHLGAAEKVIEKGRRITAHNLEAAEVDIEFSAGRLAVAGTDRGLDMKEVAALAFQPAAAARRRVASTASIPSSRRARPSQTPVTYRKWRSTPKPVS